MRALILAFAVLFALPATAAAQRDWARAYEEGKDAFERGNWALAEQKMIEAREGKGAPKQHRRANWSSVLYKPFIPDYYLGLIAAKQGQYQKAERYLQSAIEQKLVTEGDREEYRLATSTLGQARDQMAAAKAPTPTPGETRTPTAPTTPTNTGTLVTNVPTGQPVSQPTRPPTNQPTTQPPANTNQPVTAPLSTPTATNATNTPTPIRPTQPVTPAEPAWQADFRRSIEASRASLRQERFSEAYSSAAGAFKVAGDSASRQQADQLRREIERGQDAAAARIVTQVEHAIRAKNATGATSLVSSLELLDANHSALPDLRASIEKLRTLLTGTAKLADVERTALRLFLTGSYKSSETELQRAVTAGVTSPRIYLLLASSRAAQALLAKESERQALVAEARKAYALAKPGITSLTAERRLISPSILRLIDES